MVFGAAFVNLLYFCPMIFHPAVLRSLASFKECHSKLPPINLLILLLDNTNKLSLSFLYYILYSYKQNECELNKKEIKEELLKLIKDNFRRHFIENEWICRAITVPDEIKEIINEKRAKKPVSIGLATHKVILNIAEHTNGSDKLPQTVSGSSKLYSETDLPANEKRKKKDAKESENQKTKLEFKRIEHAIKEVKQFMPVDLNNSTFLYNKNKVVLDTQRKRNDLVNPVKLQFIKHFDQRRPPIYKVKNKILKNKLSYKRMPEILNYDDDSSAEWDAASTETEVSVSDESIEQEQENDWIEKDSSESDEVKYGKKPTISYKPINIEILFEPEI